MSWKTFWIGMAVCGVLAGCVRYVPSRTEINKPYGGDPAVQYVGLDAFYLYDREQRSRLEKLIADRIESTPDEWDTAYRIGAGDELRIEVKNFEDISREYEVNLDGYVNLPFVGKLAVAGLTDLEVADKVAGAVQDYVLEPQVHVEVTDYSAYKVWIVGGRYRGTQQADGETTRSFPLRRPNYSLVELLVETGEAEMLASGGVIYLYPQGGLYADDLLSKEKIAALRRTTLSDSNPFCPHLADGWAKNGSAGRRKVCGAYDVRDATVPIEKKYHKNARIQVDVEELFGGIAQPPLYVPLRPGDAIYVPPPPLIQVYGEVVDRGTFRATRSASGGGGNILTGGQVKPTLMSVLTEAKGLTYSADIHSIEIFRELEFGKKVVLTVDFEDITLRGTQDIRLRDGDIVWVPSQPGRFSEQHSINAINAVLNAGNNLYRTTSQ